MCTSFVVETKKHKMEDYHPSLILAFDSVINADSVKP